MFTQSLFLTAFLATALIIAPFFLIYLRAKRGKTVKTGLIGLQAFAFFAICVGLNIFGFANALAEGGAGEAAVATASGLTDAGIAYISAAVATSISGIGGGIAVASTCSAVMGAISENEKIFGKAILFAGLAEGVALYGFIISFMILGKV